MRGILRSHLSCQPFYHVTCVLTHAAALHLYDGVICLISGLLVHLVATHKSDSRVIQILLSTVDHTLVA